MFFPINGYSSVYKNGEDQVDLNWTFERRYISYEFGASNMINVFIADGDSICDVLIYDLTGKRVLTTCPKSPVLTWAFDKMTDEVGRSEFIVDNSYKTFRYQLSLHDKTNQIVVASSTEIIKNNDVKDKVNELKLFMVDLWYSNFMSRQPLNYDNIML